MGLDMYLYKVSKANLDPSKIFESRELYENSITTFDNTVTLPKAISDNVTTIKVRSQYVNTTKMLEDYGYSNSATAYISMQSCDSIRYRVTDGDKEGSIEMTHEELEEKYCYHVISKKLCCVLEEIDYQRKGLNDEGWALLPENCEYSDDKENIREMTEVGGLSPTFIENWIDNETVFLAWW